MSGSGRRRRPAGSLVAGALLLALAWACGSHARPPLRDAATTAGSYAYCQTPSGTGPSAVSQVDHNIVVLNGVSPAIDDHTAETPPQAELHVPAGAFTVRPGTVAIRVVILCAPPPAMLPVDGPLDGNVYRFAVTAQGVSLTLQPGRNAIVVLRGPAGAPNPVLEQFEAGLWTRLDTRPVGGGAPAGQSASVSDLGDFGLVVTTSTVPLQTSSDHTGLIVAVTVIAVVLFVAGALVTMRGRVSR